MEFETFSNLHVIVPDASPSRPLPHAHYSFLLNLQSQVDMQSTLHYVFSEANSDPFSITLHAIANGMPPEDRQCLETLCLILCHRNYIRHNGQPVIGMHYDTSGVYGMAAFFNRLLSKLSTQGLERLAVADITKPPIHSAPDFQYAVFPFDETENFYDGYIRRITQSATRLHIFMRPGNDQAVTTLIEQRKQAEQRMKVEAPLLFRLIGDVQRKEQQLQQYKTTLKSKEEELASKAAYLDFLLHKTTDYGDLNEIMKIKKFYHHEYEVLPIWYKRFGHVLKVLSGKRTFRSLFDNNAKKHT